MDDMTWIDAHVHVSNLSPDGAIERGDILGDLTAVLDGDGADLRLVITPDFPWPGRMTRDPAALLAGNEFTRDLVHRAPGRLYGGCMVNPHFMDESVRVMRVCFEEWGFVMLGEMLQYIMRYWMNSDEVVQLVRLALGYDVPVQVHISTSNSGPQGQFEDGGTGQLEDLLDLVQRVPEAKYILAHFIGTPDNPPVVDGYLDQIERRFGRFPDNLWAEIRDFSSPGVRSALRRIPATRLIAGTDWVTRVGPPFPPYGVLFPVKTAEGNPYPPSVANMAELLTMAGASREDVANIAYRNAAELFKIPVG